MTRIVNIKLNKYYLIVRDKSKILKRRIFNLDFNNLWFRIHWLEKIDYSKETTPVRANYSLVRELLLKEESIPK